MSKPLPEIPFSLVEREFRLAAVGSGLPAVAKTDKGYTIRVLVFTQTTRSATTERYDYFRCDPDGTVTEAPRGYAKNYRPARITGLDAAVEKYAGGAR